MTPASDILSNEPRFLNAAAPPRELGAGVRQPSVWEASFSLGEALLLLQHEASLTARLPGNTSAWCAGQVDDGRPVPPFLPWHLLAVSVSAGRPTQSLSNLTRLACAPRL